MGDGDGEAERFELPDVVTDLLVLVGAAGVVARAEVVEGGRGVGEQVPDDHQDGTGDRDQGLELAAAPDDAPVALAEEGIGLGRGGRGLAEQALEIGVALAGLAAAAAGSGLDGPGAQLRPRRQVGRGRELAHIQADLGEDQLGSVPPHAGNLIQAGDS